jgi:hypothetical protein
MTEWININERLPDHHQIILVYSQKIGGYGTATFVDSIKMNEVMSKTQYANECVDELKHPYYFVSQEVRQHTFNSVSHWMPLPNPPEI